MTRSSASWTRRQLDAAAKTQARLTTVLDDDYPANLRLVPDAPPFLFYRGALALADARSVAVVGTRQATEAGRTCATRLAHGLASQGIVVVSGLARGIDTAAHTATVSIPARTVAVIGQGITTPTYPSDNRELADRIVDSGGAVVSQFWPTDPPGQWRFPARNLTMSGFTQGTVAAEASETSGARLQAQAACRHGKLVFLPRSLVTEQLWAQEMVGQSAPRRDDVPTLFEHGGMSPAPAIRRVIQVEKIADVLTYLATAEAVQAAAHQRHQLAHSAL